MLITINKAFAQESDYLKQRIEELERQLEVSSKTETKSGSESESDLDSELNNESYVENDERPKRIQSSRKVKVENLHVEEARVLFYFFYN